MNDEIKEAIKSRDFEDISFSPDPSSAVEYLAALWQKVNVIDMKVTDINGRVGLIERFMWAIGGALVVIAAVIVPQWLGLVK